MGKNEYQGRNWFIMTYADSIYQLEEICKNCNNIFQYAIIYHDKDINFETGELKTPHYHISIVLKSARSESCVRNYFEHEDKDGLACSVLIQATRSKKGSTEYLTHKNQPDKYQYNEEDIIFSDKNYFYSNSEEDTFFSMVDDMLKGYNLYDMAKIYGRDFVFHYSQIKLLVRDIILQEQNHKYMEEEEFAKKHNMTEIKGIEQIQFDDIF